MTSVRVLLPVPITDASFKAGTTIDAVDASAGESAWVSAGTYAIGAECVDGDSVYSCVQAHDSRTARPSADPSYWLRKGPSNRYAAFDDYTSTTAKAGGSITYVLDVGFVDGAKLYGVKGRSYSMQAKHSLTGAVIASEDGPLYAPASGFWDLLFGQPRQIEQLALDIPPAPGCELTLTIEDDPEKEVAVGTIKIGSWLSLIGDSEFGGAKYGASSERKTYTDRTYNADGSYTTVIRPGYRDVRCNVVIDANEASYVDSVLERIADIAVPFEASGLPRYGYLNSMGFVSGTVSADTWVTASLALNIKGNI